MNRDLSFEYIRGLIEGEGSFTFSTSPDKRLGKIKIPSFQLRMHSRDKYLIEGARNKLGLNHKVHTYHYPGNDGCARGPQAFLIVRDFMSLRDIIIPLFYKSLYGNKGLQFENWVKKIGTDPLIHNDYKIFSTLYKNGYFEEKAKKYI